MIEWASGMPGECVTEAIYKSFHLWLYKHINVLALFQAYQMNLPASFNIQPFVNLNLAY